MGADPLYRGGGAACLLAGFSHHGFPVCHRHRGLRGHGLWLPAGPRDGRRLEETGGVDRAVQRRWSRVQGALFLANAAICPAGWLLAWFADFDTDFILLAQYVGFVIAAASGAAPLILLAEKK